VPPGRSGSSALAQLGIQTTSFIAVIGAAGLAVGLALQGSLANFAAGVLMLIFRPFKVGDYIEGAGVEGIVEEIHIFSTLLGTFDNKAIIVPNAKLTGDNITNYTMQEKRRVDLVFGVSYGEDTGKVKRVIDGVLGIDPRILKDPPPTVGVLGIEGGGVNFAVRPWFRTEDYWDVYFDTNENMKKRFDAEGIQIPVPRRDVHLRQSWAAATAYSPSAETVSLSGSRLSGTGIEGGLCHRLSVIDWVAAARPKEKTLNTSGTPLVPSRSEADLTAPTAMTRMATLRISRLRVRKA
jgi:small conductance mechanosensitive channel